MSETSPEVKRVLKWIASEINCGKVLIARTPEEKTWNNAHDRALSIIHSYAEGLGLYQIFVHPEEESK